MVYHNTAQHTTPCCAVLCCAVVWCAVVCCGMVCCAVVCCGMVCCGVLCCAVVWCSLRSKRFRRFFRPFEAQKLGRAQHALMEGAGKGRGDEKRKRLPANPMILKNAPLTLSQLDKFIV